MHVLDRVDVKAADTLAKLWVETFTQAYTDVHTPENIHAYCAANFSTAHAHTELSDPKTECVIANNHGTPVGFTLLKHHACPVELKGLSSELKQIYILADQYGAGLGKTLYNAALDSLRTQNRKWVWLYVSDINHRAKAFYQKLGFEDMGTGPIFEVGTDRLSSTLLAKPI